MSTIKSSTDHLTLNADGASKEVKIQRNGTQVLATTSSGIDVTGGITANGTNSLTGLITHGANHIDLYDSDNLIINGGYSSGSLVFNTNNTERLRIDSAGRVTMPYQPAFMAQFPYGGGSSDPGSGAVYPFSQARYNIGSCYNASTYRFTAPVSGRYIFGVQLLTNNSGGRHISYLRVNGSNSYQTTQTYELSADSDNYNDAQANTVFNLSANDYVDVYISSSNLYNAATGQNKFYGALLG